MIRLSSMFFMISLIFFVLFKAMPKQKKIWMKLHEITGVISAVLMCTYTLNLGRKTEFIKYAIYSIFLIGILITGYIRGKNKYVHKRTHLVLVIGYIASIFILVRL